MNAHDRASNAPGGGPQGVHRLNAVLHPLRMPRYPTQQQLRPHQHQGVFPFNLNNSVGPAIARASPPAFLWQQGNPLGQETYQTQAHAAPSAGVRLSSRLPLCGGFGPQGQPLMVRVLPNQGIPEHHHHGSKELGHSLVVPGGAPRNSARLVVQGAASRSQSRGALPTSMQGVDTRQFRMAPHAPLAVPLPSPQYPQAFSHGPPAGVPGVGHPQLFFKQADGSHASHRVRQYLFPPQHPMQTTKSYMEQKQGSKQHPFEKHQHVHPQQSSSLTPGQVLNKTQQNSAGGPTGCSGAEAGPDRPLPGTESLPAAPGMPQRHETQPSAHHYSGREQACPRGVTQVARESTQSPMPPFSDLHSSAGCAAAKPASSRFNDGTEKDTMNMGSVRSLENEVQNACQGSASAHGTPAPRGSHDNTHLWAAPDEVPDSALEGVTGRSARGVWARASTGGALLRNKETKNAGIRHSPARYGEQKSAALRSASAQPVLKPMSKEGDGQLLHEEHIFTPKARQSSSVSTTAPSLRDAQDSYCRSSTQLSTSTNDQEKSLSPAYDEENTTGPGYGRDGEAVVEEPTSAAACSNDRLETDLTESIERGDESPEEEQSSQEERYVKVLVPGYLKWRQKQAEREGGELEADAEKSTCLWASDLIIDTSRKGMGREITVNTKQCRAERPLINTCLERLGWIRDDQTTNKGNIIWLGGSVPDHDHLHFMRNAQVVNRFPGMWDMTKKRMLSKVLYLYQELFPDLYDFSPPCWSFPEDRARIEKLLHPRNVDTYIIKPDGGAMGSGVQLVSRYRDIDAMILRGEGNYVMQKYIDRPRLLNRRKFDLRIYAAVYSVTGQLKLFLSRVGMARFCTHEYRPPTRRNQDNAFMHLTNYSINKENTSFFMRSPDIHNTSNSKRLLKDVLEDLRAEGVNVESVWKNIKDITVKTFVCLQPWLNLRYRHVYRGLRQHETSRCFQFLGLDILLDENDKCWLLEVNSNPSLRIDYFDSQYEGIDVQLESTMDRAIKEPAVSEALALASKLLLRPEKKKPKSSQDAANGSAVAAGVNRSGNKTPNESSSSAGKSGKAKARGGVGKSKKTDSQRPVSPPQGGESQDPGATSPTFAQKTRPAALSEDFSPTLRRSQSMQNAANASEAVSPKKEAAANSASLVGRNTEVASPALRRCASLSENRRITDEKRRIRRVSSTESLAGRSTAYKTNTPTSRSEAPLAVANPNTQSKTATAAGHARGGATAGPATESSLSLGACLLASKRKKTSEAQNDDASGDVSDSEAGDARASLQVDSELINAAYKEIEKCMECFNVLGLRFQRSSMLPLKQTSNRWANGGCGSQTSEELDVTRTRRGASRTRAHAPFRPFLRKDRNVAKKNALPVKSTYTKLHKDILKPVPEDELHPQGCWLSLEKEAAALAGETKLVRRVQLLFERVTAFPRKIALERSRWLEVCEEVKLNEIVRKVQVAVAPQQVGSRGSTPQPPFSSFRPTPPPRPPQPSVSRRGVRSGSMCRSASTISVVADSPEGHNARGRPGGLVRQRSNAAASIPLSAPTAGRKRRLTMTDLDTLFLQQLQQMRRQMQLQDSGRGLGLLEFAHMLKVLAVLCYPFLPHKASLVAMFLSETGANPDGSLDQVVGELEREQNLALSAEAGLDSVVSPAPTRSALQEHSVSTSGEIKKQRLQDIATRERTVPEVTESERDGKSLEKKDSTAMQKPELGAVTSPPERSGGKGSQPEKAATETDTPGQTENSTMGKSAVLAPASSDKSDSKPAVGQFEGALPGLAARPATAAEEAITLLARRVAEGTCQLNVLEANQRHLEQHLKQLHELRQRHLLQQVALERQPVTSSEALLRIANIDDIFGPREHGWPKKHPNPDVRAAHEALSQELAACEAGIRSANHELQKTIQVRAAVSARHQQHDMELRRLRQQQRLEQMRKQEEDEFQARLAREQRNSGTANATTAAVLGTGCSTTDAETPETSFLSIKEKDEAVGDSILPTRAAEAQEVCPLAGNDRKKQMAAVEDSKAKRSTISTNGSATDLRSATADRREHGNRSPQHAETPEWHETLCAAWPDINSQVLGAVPKGELKEAFQLLIDFFELRLDLNQCNAQWAGQ